MRATLAKALRKEAVHRTIGQPAAATRKLLKQMKRMYYEHTHPSAPTKKRKGYFCKRRGITGPVHCGK